MSTTYTQILALAEHEAERSGETVAVCEGSNGDYVLLYECTLNPDEDDVIIWVHPNGTFDHPSTFAEPKLFDVMVDELRAVFGAMPRRHHVYH